MSFDTQLLKPAEVYVGAFRRALVRTENDFREVLGGRGHGFSAGANGTVEFTDELRDAARFLTKRAVDVYGAAKVHERSVDEIIRKVAFASDHDGVPKPVAKEIVRALTEAATTEHVVVRPNRLFLFRDDVEAVRTGPIRIVARNLLNAEVHAHFPNFVLTPETPEGGARAFISHDGTPQTFVQLPDLCWSVQLKGMPKGHELQALWMIDVAISFIRLQYKDRPGLFPNLADIEPHPILSTVRDTEGFTIGPDGPRGGSGTQPPWYEVGTDLADELHAPEVQRKAELLFDPKRGTLAERMQQMLGWLTRARRAAEPAERALLFFTAIEALLSPSDKGEAVTQSIARYAGVIWTRDPDRRQELFKSITTLYDVRSRVVHRGERSVAVPEANTIHFVAWTLAYVVLKKGDLMMSHRDFLAELKAASFGAEWPREFENGEPKSNNF